MSASHIEMSPIQLKQLLFGRVYVEAVDFERLPDDVWAPNFDMSGVGIQHQIEVIPRDEDEDGTKRFVVAVVLKIPNAEAEAVVAPYSVDVEAQGLFEVAPMGDDEQRRETLLKINGASVIISSIREQITQLTARSVYGPLTLPTLRVLASPSTE